MKRVTIDQLDIKSHQRYAEDQKKLDTRFLTESSAIGSYTQIAGMSTIYPSKLDQLFQIEKCKTWACFEAPVEFLMQSNRFFSYRLLPSIYLPNEKAKDEDQEEAEEKEDQFPELIKSIKNAQKGTKQSVSDFENEKSTLISLLESINYLDRILMDINNRKRQYQKG